MLKQLLHRLAYREDSMREFRKHYDSKGIIVLSKGPAGRHSSVFSIASIRFLILFRSSTKCTSFLPLYFFLRRHLLLNSVRERRCWIEAHIFNDEKQSFNHHSYLQNNFFLAFGLIALCPQLSSKQLRI